MLDMVMIRECRNRRKKNGNERVAMVFKNVIPIHTLECHRILVGFVYTISKIIVHWLATLFLQANLLFHFEVFVALFFFCFFFLNISLLWKFSIISGFDAIFVKPSSAFAKIIFNCLLSFLWLFTICVKRFFKVFSLLSICFSNIEVSFFFVFSFTF